MTYREIYNKKNYLKNLTLHATVEEDEATITPDYSSLTKQSVLCIYIHCKVHHRQQKPA